MKVLVTGGAGFIGSHISDFLISNNFKVKIIDNLSNGKISNIEHLLNNDNNNNFEFIKGDICDIELLRRELKDIDIICHQAALGSVPRSMKFPELYHSNNITGFFNILLVAKEYNIKRIVYASSSSVYGDSEILPKKEEITGKVLSPYALSKWIDELYAELFTRLFGLECIGLRYFNVFGKRQNKDGDYAAVIPKFVDMINQNIRPLINGDGNFSRDFTYIENVVQANYLAMTTKNCECFGKAFNIGCGGNTSIYQVFNTIRKILKKDIEPIFGQNREGDIPHSLASIELSQKLLGYNPKISFEEGIEKMLS